MMEISTKQRRWLIGVALLLTVIAVFSVDKNTDSDNDLVEVNVAKKREMPRKGQTLTEVESSDVLVDKLQRPTMPSEVKDMFPASSWYVPPPVTRVVPPPAAPPLPFVFIGKMQEDGNKYVVFLERQNRIYLVREGGAIDANYRVDSINVPVMTLTYIPLDIKQTVQIGEAN
jgi:hypothetical protein